MKFNWKKITALLLAAILMLAMTGLSEEEITLEEGILIEDDITIEGSPSDDLPSLEDGNLGLQLDDIGLSVSDVTLEEPAIEEVDAPEDGNDGEAISNALVTKVTIGVKEKYTLNTSSLKGKLIFASSNKKVAAVTQKGVVVGKKVGTAKITITVAKKKRYTVTVTVAKAPTKVTLNNKSASMEVGDTLQLKATLPRKTASNKMTWSSSDKSVATVSQKGKVTAKGEGTATITVKTFNGKKATCKVTVEEEYIDEEDEDEDEDDNRSYELRSYMGMTIDAVNADIPDKLVQNGKYYQNDYFAVTVNDYGYIDWILIDHSIIPSNGGAKYQLWGIYPYMGISDAERRLSWGLWEPVAGDSTAILFYSNSFPSYAVTLFKNSSNSIAAISYSIRE